MTVKVWDKPFTQKILKSLRTAGYTVTKIANGYTATATDGTEVFKAMIGTRGYLIRHEDGLFEYS